IAGAASGAGQLGDRFAMVDDRCRAAIEIFDENLRCIDPEVLINRRQKISRAAVPLDHVLATFICGTDEAPGLDSAAGPNIRERAGPVVAAGLFGPGRSARITCTGT